MLSDRVYIVTGAGHGLGEATALKLAELGATVVVNDLGTDVYGVGEDPEPAQSTASEIREQGGQAMAHFGDVTSLAYTEELIEDTVDEYGRVDGLANFAGSFENAPIHEMTAEQWDRVVDVHLRGHFSLIRNISAHWEDALDDTDRQRGVVTVSSRSSFGSTQQLNYSTAKAGILGLTRTAARELYPSVRVNTLLPAAYTRQIVALSGEDPSRAEEMPPENVAAMVGYLLSDDAEDITGCSIFVGGDKVGLVSDPDIYRVGIREGGWNVSDLVDQFTETVGSGETLNKAE